MGSTPVHRLPCSRAVAPATVPARGWVVAARAVGVYFAAAAVLNTVHTARHAPGLMGWFRDNAWVAPYRRVLTALVPAAPGVVLGTAAFEAVVGCHLLSGRRVSGALRWAQAGVLGLVPALPWPYWVPNAVTAVIVGLIRRGVVGSRSV